LPTNFDCVQGADAPQVKDKGKKRERACLGDSTDLAPEGTEGDGDLKLEDKITLQAKQNADLRVGWLTPILEVLADRDRV
jgi:hypothetical protein